MKIDPNCILGSLGVTFLFYGLVYILLSFDVPLGFVQGFLLYLFVVAYTKGIFWAGFYLLISFVLSWLILFGICKLLFKR